MSRKVVVNFRRMREQLRFFGGLVQWMGFPTASIEVEHAERFEGKSTYTFAKLWKLASETIIAYSDKPLRLAVRFGFLMAFFAFCYGVYILAHALFYGSPIPGWSSLIVSLVFHRRHHHCHPRHPRHLSGQDLRREQETAAVYRKAGNLR